MKKVTAIALILVMSMQCLYKLGVITYFNLNREYIAEVLCINKEKPITMCNGQCFLNKNLKLVDESTSEDEALPTGKQQIDFPVFLISKPAIPLQQTVSLTQGNFHYTLSLSSKHLSAPFHPPSFSLLTI